MKIDCSCSGQFCGELRNSAKDSLAAHTLVSHTPPDTDGESMIPEPQRSSTSVPDGGRVVSDHIGDDPDASFAMPAHGVGG